MYRQGEWKPKRISNPAYKGKWVAPDIANPDFVDDPELYAVVKDNGLVGFELWQVSLEPETNETVVFGKGSVYRIGNMREIQRLIRCQRHCSHTVADDYQQKKYNNCNILIHPDEPTYPCRMKPHSSISSAAVPAIS